MIDDAEYTEVEDVYGDYENLDIKTDEFGAIAKSSYPNDILQLTAIESDVPATSSGYGVIAEYKDIDTQVISVSQQKQARDFVSKIEKFVLELKDVELTKDHEEYIRQVGTLQFQNMADLMELVQINKQMIQNVIARINASQAEDYTIIAAYNNLVNQHLKLSRELANVYKSIPTVIKKMRSEILSESDSSSDAEGLMTEAYGQTQFNSSKDLIRKMLEKRNQDSQTAEA